jgi:phosphatidylserine/phosphatidylglycerophosphate/cardiolipin synthase-like enzyme
MKKFTCFVIWLIFLASVLAQLPDQKFEIVESIPDETKLDNPDIRNTPKVWLELINSAKKSIDIEQFYISNKHGSDLEKVIRAIENRAEKGIRVRIIVESNMAQNYPETINRLKKYKNIKVRTIEAFGQSGGVQHAKFFIIDRQKVFLGSQNFDWRALEHIHEIGLSIEHTEYAEQMSKIFELDWQQSKTGELVKTEKYGNKKKYQIEINDEKLVFLPTASPYYNMPANFYSDEKAIIDLIDNARDSIMIQLLSYSPSDYDHYYQKIDNALRRASNRGVKVEILLADWCTKEYEIPYLKSLQVLPNIDIKLSTIPQHSSGYIPYARVEHCKYMLVDENFTWLGTSNWKKDYFYNSRNIGLIIESNQINQLVKNVFLKSWQGPFTDLVDITKNYTPKEYGVK